jgi:FdhD protein
MTSRPQVTGNNRGSAPITLEYDTITYHDAEQTHRRVVVCQEERIRVCVNGIELVTMTMSPSELAEFACGYLISEGVVQGISHIEKIHVEKNEVQVTIPDFEHNDLSKNRVIRTSGGEGIILEEYDRHMPETRGFKVHRGTIFSAIGRLNDFAVLWKETGGTHCTVLFDEQGEGVVHAEDMGRHTSLDKVIGKAHLAGVDMSKTFIVCSGRMPAGMVSKIWRAGIPIVITNNAPSAAGIDLARTVNLTLAGFVRPPRMVIYSGGERILP